MLHENVLKQNRFRYCPILIIEYFSFLIKLEIMTPFEINIKYLQALINFFFHKRKLNISAEPSYLHKFH